MPFQICRIQDVDVYVEQSSGQSDQNLHLRYDVARDLQRDAANAQVGC